MKQFIDKLIERLEELQKLNYEAYETAQWNNDKIMYINASNAYANAITEVNQLAEEHKDDIQTIDVSELLGESEQVKQSNADRLRTMSDEELALFLYGIDHYCDNGQWIVRLDSESVDDDKSDILDWLQSEVEE